MVRSIRWRLILSYMGLTLFTAVVVGLLSILLVRYYIERQQVATLTENAEAVALQASLYLTPHYHGGHLQELSTSAAFLSGAQVRILNEEHHVVADSGANLYASTVVWYAPGSSTAYTSEVSGILIPTDPTGSIRITTLPKDAPQGDFCPEGGGLVARGRRSDHAWGDQGFELTGYTNNQQASYTILPRPEAPSVQVTIGDPSQPVGYVEMTASADFGDEPINTTTRAFGVATVGAVAIAAMAGVWTSRRLTAPLQELSDTATRMGKGDLSVRAPVYEQDEIGQVATQFNRMAESLEASFTELGTERDTLRRFIADASHELRTPITALKTFTELLQGAAAEDRDAKAEFLAESANQIRRLEWITQNLLDLSRLDAGLIELDRESLRVVELLNDVTVTFRGRAQEKDITLAVSAPPDLTVNADQPRLEMAISNLVDNAIKFATPASTIAVTAETVGEKMHLSVHNEGTAIPADVLPFIFERFYRGFNSPTGSGLGLAIVQSIVKAHGGDISVVSTAEEGTTFTLTI